MKVEEYWKISNEFSGKASDISRQLAFAAIAVIWLFKIDTPTGNITIPPDLILARLFDCIGAGGRLTSVCHSEFDLAPLCSLSRKKSHS
jgi:hypothetical protein